MEILLKVQLTCDLDYEKKLYLYSQNFFETMTGNGSGNTGGSIINGIVLVLKKLPRFCVFSRCGGETTFQRAGTIEEATLNASLIFLRAVLRGRPPDKSGHYMKEQLTKTLECILCIMTELS